MLQYAFEHYGFWEVIELLLKKGADPNVKRSDGYTLLMNASKKGRERLIYWMLKNGLRLDEQDAQGDTALMYAVRWKRTEIVKLLLAQGANATLLNRDGKSALDMATPEIAEILNKWAR